MAKLTKEEALKKVTEGDGEFQVFTHEEHESFLNNLKDTEVFKQQIDGRVSEIHQHYDNDFFALTGKRKAQDEKTYDFIKREVKAIQDQADDIKAKNDELQKAVDDKSDSKAIELLRGQLDTMKDKHQTYREDADNKYKALESESTKMRILNEFDRSMTGLKFKDAAIIPEDVRNAMINNAKTELAKTADYVDGKLVFRDSEGKIMYNDLAQLLSAKEILSEKLKSIIDAGRKAEGVDIEDPEIRTEDGKVIVNVSIPDSVKTNVDLTNHLMGLGMKRDSEEYRAAYAKYNEKLQKVT